ncbi:hypothetical protein J4E91_008438 [Alternaria rosae]|nr:hypothetical protein J4E91_008438 [Alternaria rosae]
MPYFIIRTLNIPRKDKRNLVILMGGSILTENNVLMIAGCFPALRPFWRVVIGKYSSYLSSNASRKNPPRGENGQSTEDKELQVYTVGSRPKFGKKPNLYSTTIRVSSEERLCPRLDGTSVETIERILHNHGDERFERQACIASTRTEIK